jgi:hypothetical protein
LAGLADFDECIMYMMQDFGTIATLIVQDDSSAVYDPTTGTLPGAVPRSYPVNAIFLDYTLQRYGLQDQSGTLIQDGDKQCFLQPINKVDPTLVMPTIQPNKDRISVAGKLYKIASLKMTNPTFNNNVVYELHLKE